MASQENALSVGNPGDLDPTFGSDGVVHVGSGLGTPRCLLEDDQGAIVHAVWVEREIWLYRILADGSADFQFGNNGVTKWGFAPGKMSRPNQLLLQSDGKYVLIGTVMDGLDDSRRQVAITRFNTNGAPDLVFGNKILPLPAGDVRASYWSYGCLQGDGKILVATPYTLVGHQTNANYNSSRLYRLQTNGEIDMPFGEGRGFIEVRFKEQNSRVTSVAVTQDGGILVGGTIDPREFDLSKSNQSVARFTQAGDLDHHFGSQGYWESEGSNSLNQMILHEGRIIFTGVETVVGDGYRACISRLTADGEFDPAFNDGERLLVDIPWDTQILFDNNVAVQPDGKIIVAGNVGIGQYAYWLRVQNNGLLDLDFADQGVHLGEASFLTDVLFQKKAQRILVAINARNSDEPRILGILS